MSIDAPELYDFMRSVERMIATAEIDEDNGESFYDMSNCPSPSEIIAAYEFIKENQK